MSKIESFIDVVSFLLRPYGNHCAGGGGKTCLLGLLESCGASAVAIGNNLGALVVGTMSNYRRSRETPPKLENDLKSLS